MREKDECGLPVLTNEDVRTMMSEGISAERVRRMQEASFRAQLARTYYKVKWATSVAVAIAMAVGFAIGYLYAYNTLGAQL